MLQGKICVVTGANTGMGKVIAKELARQGATVVMVCRNIDKGQAAQREIQQLTGNPSVDLMIADLSSQQAVRRLAQEFQQHYSQLHVLINNAGGHYQKRQLSSDGMEMNLAVNFLGSFLLTNLLLDQLYASASARIINVASNSMTRTIHLRGFTERTEFYPNACVRSSKACYGTLHLRSGSTAQWNWCHRECPTSGLGWNRHR